MFPFIGIHANEEPRTEISPNGLYNTSDLNTAEGSSFSQDLLAGRSEFTFMFWSYVDSATGTISVQPYKESTIFGSSQIIATTAGIDQITVSIKNSNGGTTSLTTNTAIDYQDWFHICVTGSVSNNRIRAYYNGVLVGSAVMTYPNANATSNEIPTQSTFASYAQINAFNRELSDTEVLEHVTDYGNGIGVLTYDAMDANQRQGLIYCSSFIKDISIGGNEFTDKSGNGITISAQPSLTGEQIYAYTDIGAVAPPNALPSALPVNLGGTAPPTTIYNVNSATLNGTSQYFDADINGALDFQQDWTIKQSFRVDGFTGGSWFCPLAIDNNGNQWIEIRTQQSPQEIKANIYTGTTDSGTITSPLVLGEWYDVIVTNTAIGQTLELWINGQSIGTAPHTAGTGTLHRLVVGRTPIGRPSGTNWMDGAVSIPRVWSKKLTNAECISETTTVKCFNDISTELQTDCEYSPRLCNWGTNAGQELVDQSGSGIVTTSFNSPTYIDEGFTIEC